MNLRAFLLVASTLACVPLGAATGARAQTSPLTPASPAPPAAPALPGADDPCASLSNLVARPTVATSACTVKPNHVLLENGYTNLALKGAAGSNVVSYPQTQIRAGIGRNFEFAFVAPSYQRQSTLPKLAGETDSAIGVKYELGYSAKMTYGVNVLETLDNGLPAFSSNGAGLLANLNATLTLSPAVGLFSTIGYNAQSAGTPIAPARYRGVDPSLGATLSLPFALTLFGEGFGATSTGPALGGLYGFDTGLTRVVGSRLQLDLEYFDWPNAQLGVHQSSLGFGASYLFGS